ncbi:MAG: LamG domain-containing protein, partial [Planctomycetota bacterium]
TAGLATTERVGIVLGNYPDTPNSNWELHGAGQTRLYWNGGEFNSYGTTDLRDNIWHHVAWVRDKAADATYTYIDGRLEATHPAAGADVTFATTHSIGGDNRSSPPNFHGLMDDLQIYSRALSHAEIAWLAGRTKPFDRPF